MLGLNKNGNNLKYTVANFFLFFGAQIAFELYLLLPEGVFPSPFQAYAAGVKSLIATLAIYGLNRATHKETKK